MARFYKGPIKDTKLTYRFDSFLLHVVQEASQKSSAEIMNFFHELAKQVCVIGTENRTGGGIRKKVIEYFPGTSIPFQLLAKGYPRQDYDHATRSYGEHYHMACDVEIGFPEKMTFIKEQMLDEIAVSIMEKALMDGEEIQMPPFPRPEIKPSKMYKDLLDSFAGREPAPPKKRGKKT